YARMLSLRHLLLVAVLPFLLIACGDDGENPVTPSSAAPRAGMAEAYVDYPVGTPLGGYTARCKCFGNQGKTDGRRTAYSDQFNPSVGVQTQPKMVALWLETGGQDLVLVKTDAIYTFEGMVDTLTDRLSAATGRDLSGKVVIASSHSHSAPANFDKGLTWYLGGDKFNREVFERVLKSMTDVALDAWHKREPAAIGIGQLKNWDPNDRVYHDRRGENDQTKFFDDIPVGPYKDPYLTVLRVDTAAGKPLGMFFAFAIHGTVADESNQLWSVEASGHVEAAVQERFDTPIAVGFLQHGAGDASPSGIDDLFARMESIGDFAADTIVDLWKNTPTTSAPLHLETVTRSIDTQRDENRVHRDYALLEYPPYNPDKNFHPDDIIYDAQGRILNPLDEFNAQYGAAFCGAAKSDLPLATIGSNVYPYASCAEVGSLVDVIGLFFGLKNVERPLPESLHAKVTASRLGPLTLRQPDGSVVTDDVLLAFFPGEPTSTYTEQFRRRAAAELHMNHTIPIGYSQDHQGYLLIPEDWLTGGYEPNINVWGPLQGEHIMEGLLDVSAEKLLTEQIDPLDPPGAYPDPVYPDTALPQNAPDMTPAAGTALTELPAHFYMPIKGLTPEVAPPQQVHRIQDIAQFMWEGGDPGVDLPLAVLEKQNSGGTWEAVHTVAGRIVSSPMHDMLMSTTPDPVADFTMPQRHYWWLAWQAVAHVIDRPGLPLGTYRFHITGKKYAGGAQTWPWPSTSYELISPSFEVVPAVITLGLNGTTLTGSIAAPAKGFRLIDVEGNSRGANPVRGATITAILADASRHQLTPSAEQVAGGQTSWTLDAAALSGATSIEVADKYGNVGSLNIDSPSQLAERTAD
ncbi:MAG TPA: neutral/alkaline non-lysosomal ceramidase N-terminal domain-containing protein, partial [Candidatus Acidoferrales bacterium]|nr:neutral/alkaline non-lysosomal ceramidase N-terminal domain-containing protein [Candidatus Acidoferrales bacterium]